MTYVLAADFHGNIEAYERFRLVLDRIKPEKAVLLGDFFDGGGALSVNNVLKKIFTPIIAVKGNCDSPTEFSSLDAGLRDRFFYEEIDCRRVCFTHGDLYGRGTVPPVLGEGDVIFFGHYHVPEISKSGGIWRICVGSAGRPRGCSSASYCVFDGKTAKICALYTDEVIAEAELI